MDSQMGITPTYNLAEKNDSFGNDGGLDLLVQNANIIIKKIA